MMEIRTRIADKWHSEFGDLATHDKVYKAGSYIFLAYVAIGIPAMIFFGQQSLNTIAGVFVFILEVIFATAVAIEYSTLLNDLYSKPWFKWLLGILAILVYRYSEAYANDFINDYVGVDPGLLASASSVLATLFLPYSWLLAVCSLLSIYILFYWFFVWIFVPFKSPSDKKQLGSWKYLARFFGLFFVFIVIQRSASLFENKESIPVLFAKHIVLSTEFFKKSGCKNVSQGELVADIDNGNVSIYNAQTSSFRTEVCELSTTKPKN